MISQIANKHADKCRFCWMCRHLCPIQLQTGKEINTPRAKGLLLSMVARGEEYDRDMAQAMYECFLCDACTNDCATGYEPPLFIREARTEAVVKNLAPSAVMGLIDREEEKGTVFEGERAEFEAPDTGEVLIYIGETAAYRSPEIAEALLSLMKKAGISYMVMQKEPSSGAMLGDLMGYVEEVRQQAAACADKINQSKASKIVVLDSYDAQIMKQKYPEWGCEINPEITAASVYVNELVREGKLQIRKKMKGTAAYHDDDRAARTFHEFASGRELTEALGYKRVEMFNHRELAKSCGTSLAKLYMPEIVKKTAAGRWDDFLRTEAETLTTSNPQAYDCLREAVPKGKELVDLFIALDKCC